jgi:hypothetical protein
MQYLPSQAKESIKEYVIDHLPEQYQVCLAHWSFKDTHLVKLQLLLKNQSVMENLSSNIEQQ